MSGSDSSEKHLSPDTILHYLCIAEDQLWVQARIGEAGDGRPIPSVSGDVGSCLLGYGGVVGRVHNYFTNLEQRKCCLLLAACKTTFSNVRIVRNDGRDSGLEEGAMMKSSVDKASYVVTLDAQEFRVFQQAYVCAAFPVLGAPEPPSDRSPFSTPTDKQPHRYAYSSLLSLARPLTPRSLHDSGVEDPEDTSVVPAETLFELLQRAFRLTPEKFVLYKKSITAQYHGKSVEMILAEVLVTQLIALEKNSNPFYCPKNFLSRQGYEQWQHLERHHITELITKFWQFSLPQPSAEQHDQIYTHAHEDYRLLMEKLIRFEYLYREESELVSTASTLPLSSASVRLLREFGLRYGVGEQYRRIVYLHYQALNFDPTVWFIQHVTFCLTALMDTFPIQRSYLIMVKQEFSLLEETLSTLDARASDALQKMKKLFSANIPKEGLETLIDLLSVTLQAKTYLLMRAEEPLKVKLQKIVQSVFPVAYETHKTVAMDELRQSQWDMVLSPRLLNMLIGKIRDEVQDYKQNYQATFLRFFDVAEEAAQMFYRLLMADVRKLKLQSEKQMELMEIDLLMLSLAYRLNQLDQDWSQYIYPQMQTWRVAFLQEGFHWLVVMKVHMQEMVTEVVAADKYTHCEVEIISSLQPSQGSCSSVDDRRHSVSTKSLTPSVHSAFSSISASQSAAGNRLAFSRPVEIQNSLIIPETSFENLHTSSQNTATGQTADRNNPKTRRSSSDPVTVSEAFSLNESYEAEVARSLGHYDSTDFLSFTHVRHSRSVPDKLYKSYELPTKLSKNKKVKVEKTQYEVELKKDSPFLTNEHHKYTRDLSTEVSVLTSQPVCIHDDLADSDSGTLTDGSIGSHDMDSAEEEFSFPPLEEVSVTPQDVSDLSTKSCKTATSEDIVVTPVKLADQINTSVASRPLMTKLITQNSAKDSVCDRQIHRSNITISEGQIKGEKSSTTFVNTPNVPQPRGGKALPVSSSVIDVVVILQRLMGIGCTLCNTLSTVSERVRYSSDPSSGSMESENNVSVNSTSRLEIYDSILTSLCSIICLYADNMLCMDLCGTPQSVARRLAGPRLVEFLQTQQMSGLIWGCRHDLMGDRDCFEYVHKDTDLLCDKHEPITQSMCTRINNVSMMISTLDHCHRRLRRLFAVHSDWSVSHKTGGFQGSAASSDIDSSEFVIVDGYKYDPDVDRLEVLETASQRFTASPGTVQSHSSQTSSLHVSDPTETYRSHLLAILRAQSRIMAYRLNLFVQDSLPVLLTLKNPRLSIETCLKPIMDFLTLYIQFLSSWLYADNFRRILECLWIFIVQDFELELSELETKEKDTEKKAHLLIQTLSHLLKFMNSQDQSMQKELLLSQADEVSFRLQLFTLPTLKLISVYRGLQHYQNQVDASSTGTLDQTIQMLREKLRMDLQTFRKCFSGTDLVTWIISNQELFQDFDPYFEESGIVFTREVGYYIAQRLVDLGLIADVEGTGLDSNAGMSRTASFMSSLEFPHLTIFSQLQHGAMDISDEENTPRGSPTATHMLHRSLSRSTPIRPFHHSGRSSVLAKMLINPLSNAQSLATMNIGNTSARTSKTVQSSPSDSGCEKTSASDTSSQKVASEKGVVKTDSDKMSEKTDSEPGFQRAIASDIAFQNNSRLDKGSQKSEPGNNSEKAPVLSNYSEDMSSSETVTPKVSASECCPQKSIPSEMNSQQIVTSQLSVCSVNKVHTSNLNIASIVTYDCTEGGPKQSDLSESGDCFPPLPSSASDIPKPTSDISLTTGSNESLSRKTVMSDNQTSEVSASNVTEMSAFQADQIASPTECSIIDKSNFCKDNENNNGAKIDSHEDFESLPPCPLDSLAKHCLEIPLSTETCDKQPEGNSLTIHIIPQERNQNSSFSSNLDLNKEQQENEALVRNNISSVSNGIHQNSGTSDSSLTDESRNISFQVMPGLVSGSKDNQEEVQQDSDTCIFTVTSQVDEARKLAETQNTIDSSVVSLDVTRREASEALPDTQMPNNSVEYDPYQRQTPVSIRSGLSSASVQILFIDSSEKFYHVTPLTNDQAIMEFGYHMNQELWQLIENCFSRKITEEYILKILYGRQRQDISAQDFIRSLPSDLVESIIHPKVNSPNSCVNS